MTLSLNLIKIAYHVDASDYFLSLKPLGHRVWLDSGKPLSNYGRYDILSAKPTKILVNASRQEIERSIAGLFDPEDQCSYDEINLPFRGGAIGYFNYESQHAAFKLTSHASEKTQCIFGLFDWALIQDHQTQQAYLLFLSSCDENVRKSVISLVENTKYQDRSTFKVTDLQADLSYEDYCAALKKINSFIHAGDVYQINFAQRFSGIFDGEPDAAYIALRQALPCPYSGYMELGDDVILSLSPEHFVTVENGKALTQPIKGTAPRGQTLNDDNRLASELLNSTKNRAENLMIVDLLRNDFSKSCIPHSVKTPSLFALESFANVHHLVSTVTGSLNPGVTPLEFLLRCFPGGSITGAPKKRAMEIISELEQHPRNIYCGSLCYQSCHGRLDANIAIRTLLVKGGHIYCWGGGGIVADSIPHAEYEESLQKINVLLDCLRSRGA